MNGINILLEEANQISDWIINLRRTIHSHPELSFNEKETAKLISSQLKEIGIDVQENVGGHGVVGLLSGGNPGKTVALRADIDALPIQELNDIPYRSKYPNCMHACGHDGHVAMLLGVAKLLAAKRENIAGNIKFIFQPAEEVIPGGAKSMIADHVLENPQVDACFGLHIWPDLPVGKVGVIPGPIMAASDKFSLIIRGKGGHGAMPHLTTGPIVTASQVVLGLQTIASRKANPLNPIVITIGKISGGSSFNIIPDEVSMIGTIRYLDQGMGEFIEEQIKQITQGICAANACEFDYQYQYGYPPTINHTEMTALVEKVAGELLSAEDIVHIKEPAMTGEDFSYFLQKTPGCYFWLGTGNAEKGSVHPLHSAHYQMDEEILPKGTALFSAITLTFLHG